MCVCVCNIMCHSVSVSIYFTKIEYHKHTITILFYTVKAPSLW